jgi:putative ABC transport system permease protein
MGPSLVSEYPEIIEFTRYWTLGKILAETEGQQHYLNKLVRVDTSFFEMFDFRLIDGVGTDLFKEPFDIEYYPE